MKDKLESFIDKCGLDTVLATIACVCGEKADHIRTSYSDETLADTWESASIAVSNCAERPAVRKVSL